MRALSSTSLAALMAGYGKRFLAEPGSRRRRQIIKGSRYYPHQGDGEIRRRLRQEIRQLAKNTVEVFPNGLSMTLWDQLNFDEDSARKFRNADRLQLVAIRNNILEDRANG